jgi:hypothetical protein
MIMIVWLMEIIFNAHYFLANNHGCVTNLHTYHWSMKFIRLYIFLVPLLGPKYMCLKLSRIIHIKICRR